MFRVRRLIEFAALALVITASAGTAHAQEGIEPGTFWTKTGTTLKRVDESDLKELRVRKWQIYLYRKGQRRGGDSHPWGIIDGSSAAGVLRELASSQRIEKNIEAFCKCPYGDSTSFNPLGPIAVVDDVSTGFSAAGAELTLAGQRLLNRWLGWLQSAKDLENPFEGAALDEYKEQLEAAWNRADDFRKMIENGPSVSQLQLDAFERDMNQRTARLDALRRSSVAAAPPPKPAVVNTSTPEPDPPSTPTLKPPSAPKADPRSAADSRAAAILGTTDALSRGVELLADSWERRAQARREEVAAAREEEANRRARFKAEASEGASDILYATPTELRDYIARGGSVDIQDERGKTPVMHTAYRGDAERLRILIEEGADLDASDAEGKTALISATMVRHGDVVLRLISAGANPFQTALASHSIQSVEQAAKFSRLNDVLALIQHVRKPDPIVRQALAAIPKTNSKDLRFAWLAATGSAAQLKEALRYGANVNARDDLGYTALHHAIMKCQSENVRTLIDAGADVNAVTWFRQTPLFLAVRLDNAPCSLLESATGRDWPAPMAELIMSIVEAGGNDTKDLSGETAAEWLSRTRKQHDDKVLINAAVALTAAQRGRKALSPRAPSIRAGEPVAASVLIDEVSCSPQSHDQTGERSDPTIVQLLTAHPGIDELRSTLHMTVIPELDLIVAQSKLAYEMYVGKPQSLLNDDSVVVLHGTARCGLQTGDVFVDDLGLAIADLRAVRSSLENLRSGKPASFRILRDGAGRVINVSAPEKSRASGGDLGKGDPRETVAQLEGLVIFEGLKTRFGVTENLPRFVARISGKISSSPVDAVVYWPFDARVKLGAPGAVRVADEDPVFGVFGDGQPWRSDAAHGFVQPAPNVEVVQKLLTGFTTAFPQYFLGTLEERACDFAKLSGSSLLADCNGERTLIDLDENSLVRSITQSATRIEYLGFTEVNGQKLPTGYRKVSLKDGSQNDYTVQYNVPLNEDMFRKR